MKLKYITFVVCFCIVIFSNAQNNQNDSKKSCDIACSSVKNQGNTGTCWSFAGCSFLESEIFRIQNRWIDLSEMYIVRQLLKEKAFNYIYRQGKAQFGEGGLNEDVIYAAERYGLMPNEIYGNNDSDGNYDTNKLMKNLEIIVKNTVKLIENNSNNNWEKEVDLLLDNHFGKVPETFMFEGKEFTPLSFYKSLGINSKDYVSLTSWGFKPHNTSFILSIPDNYLNHSFYNLKLDDYMSIVNNALAKKYSIGIDMDISEPGFNSNKGFAILPVSSTAEKLTIHSDEKTVTVTERDQSFLTFETVDDHLMHMVGFSKNEKGQLFYKIKNSWGKNNEAHGFIMLSENYFKSKSISMLLHKDGLPIAIKTVLGIN